MDRGITGYLCELIFIVMNNKAFLFTGIILLTLGILLRVFTNLLPLAFVLMALGGLSKVIYLTFRIRQGNYKPGYELLLLLIGLLVFFTGIYLRTHSSAINPWFFMGPGILLKISFVVVFMQKLKANH